MRSANLGWILLVLVTTGLSQETGSVADFSTSGWVVTGPSPRLGEDKGSVVLPAGTQIARPAPSANFSVSLTTQPVWAQASADWPILEVGQVALVFVRIADEGRLLLVLGAEKTALLPERFPLDKAGNTQTPLKLTLDVAGEGLLLEIDGKASGLLDYQLGIAGEVVLSAGGNQDWPIASLEVVAALLSSPGGAIQPSGPFAAPTSSSPTPVPSPGNPREMAAALVRATANRVQVGATRDVAKPALLAGASRLESYTPAAVRLGQAEKIRAVAELTLNR